MASMRYIKLRNYQYNFLSLLFVSILCLMHENLEPDPGPFQSHSPDARHFENPSRPQKAHRHGRVGDIARRQGHSKRVEIRNNKRVAEGKGSFRARGSFVLRPFKI